MQVKNPDLKFLNEFSKDVYAVIKHLIRWTIIILPIAVAIGSVVAFFLWLLNTAIHFRFDHSWLLFLLPAGGLLIHFIYQSVGKSSEKGNNLIIEQIHEEGGGVPKRMAPIILITSVITHLFGGSAGREGTAVQIGGSIAAMFAKWFNLKGTDMRVVLTAGVAAGFGAVFGTPVTGAIFAMEVLTIGKIQYDALLPSLIAAVAGSLTVDAWHIHHVQYHIAAVADTHTLISGPFYFDILLLLKVIVASAAFGLAGFVFTHMIVEIKKGCLKIFKHTWMIPVFGGIIIIALTMATGQTDYLSLGIDPQHPGDVTIPSSFYAGGSHAWSWLWKSIYTSVTIGTGFKGGEVTPLFYIGSTLGNTLAGLFNAPVSLFAALGFIAVFAGATNTPLACTIMGVELFGGEHILLFAVACFTAYFFSGHSGIYSAQRTAIPKIPDGCSDETSLPQSSMVRAYIYQKLKKYSFKRHNERTANNQNL